MPEGALYVGAVMHMRLWPVRHQFRYRLFSLLIDIDRVQEACSRLGFLSLNRWNLFSFHERDHGPRDGSPLRPWVDGILAGAGLAMRAARVELLSVPRVAGHAFNPLSLYFCWDERGGLVAVIYEVKNTFGEQHPYVVIFREENAPRKDAWLRHKAVKTFHVSPFLGLDDACYEFRLLVPGARFALAIRESEGGRPLLHAHHHATRRTLSDGALLRLFFTHPVLGLAITLLIRWQALRLWLAGIKARRKPAPPVCPFTHARP